MSTSWFCCFYRHACFFFVIFFTLITQNPPSPFPALTQCPPCQITQCPPLYYFSVTQFAGCLSRTSFLFINHINKTHNVPKLCFLYNQFCLELPTKINDKMEYLFKSIPKPHLNISSVIIVL